ncbi:MAG: hypothetical protein Kow0074_17040 [Candidatus Zixiibacteriota bacterium]
MTSKFNAKYRLWGAGIGEQAWGASGVSNKAARVSHYVERVETGMPIWLS